MAIDIYIFDEDDEYVKKVRQDTYEEDDGRETTAYNGKYWYVHKRWYEDKLVDVITLRDDYYAGDEE